VTPEELLEVARKVYSPQSLQRFVSEMKQRLGGPGQENLP
jgi:hypothetical protein